MKLAAKWFVAGGSFLMILGFLLPAVTVSNSGTRIALSLLQIASVSYWFFLYLVPILALAMLILALIPVGDEATKKIFLAGQVGGLGVMLLFLLGALAYTLIKPQVFRDPTNLGGLLPPEFLTLDLSFWPAIGFFTIIFGVGFATFGIFTDLPITPAFPIKENASPQIQPSASPMEDVKVDLKEAYLEGKKGSYVGKNLDLQVDNFSIGRGRNNDLQLADKKVSRLHARIRYSQGAWFVQDQDSKIGTHVNEKPVKAIRLNPNDRIKIGDEVFIFHFKKDKST